jgi:hypothetical protein
MHQRLPASSLQLVGEDLGPTKGNAWFHLFFRYLRNIGRRERAAAAANGFSIRHTDFLVILVSMTTK